MLSSLKIQNFRGFGYLEMNDLGAVNLIVGKNNCGKTSLLEAIYILGCGQNMQFASNPLILRIPELDPQGTIEVTELFLSYMFQNQNMRETITIDASFENGRRDAQLLISLEKNDKTPFPIDVNQSTNQRFFLNNSIKVELHQSNPKSIVTSRLTRDENGMYRLASPSGLNPFINCAIHTLNSKKYPGFAQRIAELRRIKKDYLVLNALKTIEPRLRSIEDNSFSGQPIICGDIGLSELVPLSIMGGGMNELAHIIVQIAIPAKNGIALMDDLESGLHYLVQPNVWTAIDEAARQSETQVFAATHSFECVAAAYKEIDADRLRLHRLQKKDGEIRCVTYSPEEIQSVFDFNFEVR